MSKLFIIFAFVLALAPAAVRAQAGHEYAPLEEKTVNYKDWTFKNLADGKPVNLRSFAQGKKLIMIVYFAPWCGNWKHEMPVAARLYEKYKGHGLEVVGISEYGTLEEVKRCFGEGGAPYTIVTESETREARVDTTHYDYRQATGDTRKWGSPWNIFLEPAKLKTKGDVLTEKAWVVNGELIEEDVEKFIRQRLGVDSTAATITAATPCEPLNLETAPKKP